MGLFGYSTGTINDIGMIAGSTSGNAYVGALVGQAGGTIANTFSSGAITGGAYTGGLVGNGLFEVSISNSFATGAVSTPSGATGGSEIGGLIGYILGGTLSNSYATGTVTAGSFSTDIGGLVGEDVDGTIVDSFATGTVSGGGSVGGLVGLGSGGTITNSYATGAITGTGNSAGGLVGEMDSGEVDNSYALGSVSGHSYAGGLIGYDGAVVTDSYAIGAVSGIKNIGGFFGGDNGGETVTHGYWDTETSGLSTAIGLDQNNQSTNVTGLTTVQLFGRPTGFSSSIWGVGPYLFPYFLWQYPNAAPQSISGIAYGNSLSMPEPLNAGTLSLVINGSAFGSTSTGANGFYYFLEAPGTISGSGSQVLVYGSGTTGAAFADNATAPVYGLSLYANAITEITSASKYSTVQSDLATAIGSNSAVRAIVNGLGTQYIYSIYNNAPNFTIDTPLTLSNSLRIDATGFYEGIAVSAPITLQGGNQLTFNSAGDIAINAPITVTGAGGVVLDYNAATTLSFGLGSSGFAGDVQFTGTPNSGQSLTINYAPYTLLYSMSDVQNINTNSTTLSGNYALANSLNASSTSSWTPVGTNGGGTIGNLGNGFTGLFEGLGNTISNLTINLLSANYVGLFGYSSGAIRDIGVIGGFDTGYNEVGELAGKNTGTIANAYATSAITGSTALGGSGAIGGLVGANTNSGTVTASFATGTVSGTTMVGGLVGSNDGAISNAYATGSVSGVTGSGGATSSTLAALSATTTA